MGRVKETMNQNTEGTQVEGEFETREIVASAVAELNKSEVLAQMEAAHRFPRSIKRFVDEAVSMATLTRETAESCIYGVPRAGGIISGPSVRLAEICMSSYGNFHGAARTLDAEERFIVAQGVAWDIEKNVRVVMETKRRITGNNGKRFGDDMIGVTGAAAASIALRNAIFRVVPRALVDTIYAKVRSVAVGDAKTLNARRKELVERLQKIGVPLERIFPRVGAKGIEDIDLDKLEQLIGLGTAIHTKGMSIDEAFPPLDDTAQKARDLEAELAGKKKTTEPKKAAAKEEPAPPAKEDTQPGFTREVDPATGEVAWIPNDEAKP